MKLKLFRFVYFSLFVFIVVNASKHDEDDHGVLYPTHCEVCKYVAVELETRLEETGKTHEVLVTGYDSMNSVGKKKRKKYAESYLRLLESLEGICDRILEYNIHKERTDSTRFAKGMSQTFKTLHGLVDKGVKVDLGIPFDLWDKPSAEVVAMKTQCETLLEKHEDDIEEWYFYRQDVPLKHFLCRDKALIKGDDGCLTEVLNPDSIREEKTKKKSETTKRKKDEF